MFSKMRMFIDEARQETAETLDVFKDLAVQKLTDIVDERKQTLLDNYRK